MAVLNLQVPDSIKAWVQGKAEGGDFSTPSEFVRSVLREKKAQEESLLGELENLLVEGINSGNAQELTPDGVQQWKATLRQRLEARGIKTSE